MNSAGIFNTVGGGVHLPKVVMISESMIGYFH